MPRCPSCAADVPLTSRFCGSCGGVVPASSEVGTVVMSGGSAARPSRTSAPASERFPPGAVLAQRYRVLGRLGKGGMGEVYRAYDLILEQDVALKFLPEAGAITALALERFRNEVRLARQVSHPNVCRVYDIGEIEGAPFLTMEYVDGEDMGSLLRRIGRLPADKALDISRRLCAGLAAAHEKGVLHRDLKPANIMIDGRGEVLITDFGLAAVAGTISADELRHGTPAYQAPEQLAGTDVTVKSDIYALGLVLYEMFTGRRAFEAATMAELMRMQREAAPASLTSLARDADPAIERVIARCLAADPRQRPGSAKAIAAALPGGDPLAAALAAGETPSPEMVAHAGDQEGIRPAVAVGLLGTVIVATAISAVLQQNFAPVTQTPFENPPEALVANARELAKHLGYTARPRDSAYGFGSSRDYLEYASQHIPMPVFRQQAAAARPAPIIFWYRQSPLPIDPGRDWSTSLGLPGFDTPGALRIREDLEGRLLWFEARPDEVDTPAIATPDWKPLFDAAHLDLARFQSATPQWTPPMAFDARAAWSGVWPESASVAVRVEAAAWHGRPVLFRVIEPWTKKEVESVTTDAEDIFWGVLSWLVIPPITGFLAWRNVRGKRADLGGSGRLGAFVFAVGFASALLGMSHVPGPNEMYRVMYVMAMNLTSGMVAVLGYLALEPYVRRRCPRMLIGWARVLQAGPRDPLAAAHALIGIALGAIIAVVFIAYGAMSQRWGLILPASWNLTTALWAPRFFAGGVLSQVSGCMFMGILLLFLFFLLRLLLRRDLAAAIGLTLLGTAINALSFAPGHLIAQLSFTALVWGILAFAMVRFGLLASIVLVLTVNLVAWMVPLTFDPSRWYFGYAVADMLAVVAAAGWLFVRSLGGRSLLNEDSLA